MSRNKLQPFKIEKKPRKGLLLMEWAVLAYVLFTTLLVLFTGTKHTNPDALILNRLRIALIVGAMWAVYRLVPCKLTMLLRVVVQAVLLAWWYPDTYLLNRVFPNLDHVFATAEQSLFGCQPSLLLHGMFPQVAVAEIMCFGYSFYYPLIVMVLLYYFVARYGEFTKAAFVIMAAFVAYYVVFDLVPVTGPTFYFNAIGLENAAHGVFPPVGDYFASHLSCLTTPGYDKGVFYFLVETAKAAGERPTAAFPSSHVGIATVCLLLALRSRSTRLIVATVVIYIPLCLSTVYLQAHYAIDAIAGLVSGVAFYYLLMWTGRKEGKA